MRPRFTISLERSTLIFSYPQAGRPITPSFAAPVTSSSVAVQTARHAHYAKRIDDIGASRDYSGLSRLHAIQRTGCDVVQAHMSELERDMQPLAEEIIAAPATSLAGLRAKALVALWEAFPANASHDGAFDF